MAVLADACRQRISFFTTLSSGADGRVSGTVDYDVFGEPVTETGIFAANSTIVFAYAGKPYDTVTGLSDYGFRDYSPSLARFTTVDPIRDGSNWYAYCNSDPVNYVDMWGERPLSQKEITFATKILGTSINGTVIDYAGIDVIEDSPPDDVLRGLTNSTISSKADENAIVSDLQDQSRGTSLPNGTIYMPGTTISSSARLVHEIFHQWQYANEKSTLDKVIDEQYDYSINNGEPYDYTINNNAPNGLITNLSQITTIEGQAQYIEDFIDRYEKQKNTNSFNQDTKDRANALYNYGIRSEAVCKVRNS